jgi:hypothetical protein
MLQVAHELDRMGGAESVVKAMQRCNQVVHVARLAAAVKVAEGIVSGGQLSPATIGRNLGGTARPKHGINGRRTPRCSPQANTQRKHARCFFVLACAIIRRGDLDQLSLEDFAISLAFIPQVASA